MFTQPMYSSPEVFRKLQSLYSDGVQLSEEKRFESAIEKFTEGINIDAHFRHQYVTQYAMRAICYVHLRKFKDAIFDLEKAIEMEPEFYHADYYFRLARCHEQGYGDVQKALDYYQKSIEINPNGVGPYYYRGLLYYDNGNYAQALPDIEKLIALDPNSNSRLYEIRNHMRKELGLKFINVDEPEIFPGKPVSKLSDYVNFMNRVQKGDISGAFADYGLDIFQYCGVIHRWGFKKAIDPSISARYLELMGNQQIETLI
ncbi:MAG: tetratricopeptide repeat protein [Sporocytophaga sp.]|uniref:tetratricopeptide repeat protein n=1 Tax=Sporocytophaga sp. TaxID=2231183 RepID=UPI001B189D97|nr:tetratricopeptide repeat protein [Sporocytophaga sp.]MBO9703006.1 tetratricopeptide repeat protein [Sporocytophaga sp.]